MKKTTKLQATISVISAAAATGDGVVSSSVGGGTAAPAPPAARHSSRRRATSSGTPACRPHSGASVRGEASPEEFFSLKQKEAPPPRQISADNLRIRS
jgi:hypothetical protein